MAVVDYKNEIVGFLSPSCIQTEEDLVLLMQQSLGIKLPTASDLKKIKKHVETLSEKEYKFTDFITQIVWAKSNNKRYQTAIEMLLDFENAVKAGCLECEPEKLIVWMTFKEMY